MALLWLIPPFMALLWLFYGSFMALLWLNPPAPRRDPEHCTLLRAAACLSDPVILTKGVPTRDGAHRPANAQRLRPTDFTG